MILIISSFSLLVIVAGMFLLAKTQKDNLSNFFKYVSYFVIIVGFLNLFAGGIHMIMRHFYQQYAAQYEMEHCKKSKHGMHKMKIYKHMSCEDGMMNEEKCMMMNDDKCSMNKEKCMDMEKSAESGSMMNGKSCCKEKMMIKKDTVIIKK